MLRPLHRARMLVGIVLGLVACAPAGLGPIRDALRTGDVAAAVSRASATPEDARTEAFALVAEHVLEADASAADSSRRNTAFAEIARIGDEARSLLDRLGDSSDPDVRTRAWLVLARRSGRRATRHLAAFRGSPDDRIRARAIEASGSHLDDAELARLLESTSADVRAAAVPHAGRRESLAHALVERARLDPSPAVRASACRASGSHADVDALMDIARSDAPAAVRAACFRAALDRMSEADRRAHIESVDAVIDETTLDLARAAGESARRDREAHDLAIARLRTGLDAERPSIRAGTAYALASAASSPELVQELARRMREETEPVVRLSYASALLHERTLADEARAVLVELAAQPTMEGVQAAVLLGSGDAHARARLEAAIGSDDAVVRGVAARSLGGEPALVTRLLLDPVPAVRDAAAATLLMRR